MPIDSRTEEHETPDTGKTVGLWVRYEVGESELKLEGCKEFEEE